jgi:hypothetical protein
VNIRSEFNRAFIGKMPFARTEQEDIHSVTIRAASTAITLSCLADTWYMGFFDSPTS